jgi:D-3-phosphoglycerate dehydrogenase / 2-oxoglutarate reductase
MNTKRILITTTSFQDTPGKHHNFLNDQNWEIEYLRGPLEENILLPIIHKYDGIICGDDSYTEKVLELGSKSRLKVISKYGVGLDRIDLDKAKSLGIKVTNCPGVNQVSVAEHVLALLFCYEKNIHLQYNSVQNKSWNRLIGNEIEGKTLGIIGLGAVGKELTKKAISLGLKVIGFDITEDKEFIKSSPELIFTNDINCIFENCDTISLHIPHNKNTDKIINQNVIFKKFKRRPILINTSRAKLIEKQSLIMGLKKGYISAYLTDVLEVEPISDNEELVGLENVIITPHIGSRTFQSVQKQATMSISNLIKYLK